MKKDNGMTRNLKSYHFYQERLLELALSRFDYANLPVDSEYGIDVRYLEKTLCRNGCAIIFKDEVLGLLGLPVLFSGQFDVYERPTSRRAYAVNGYEKKLTESDSVLIYNNFLRKPTLPFLEQYAERLAILDGVIDINVNAQKTPVLIACDESERLTMENLYLQYAGNKPVIMGKKSLANQPLSVLKTDAPFLCDKLWELKTNVWNEALTFLGIPNVAIQKKERLVSDEVNRNLGGVIASQNTGLAVREQAIEQVNAMFGTEIEVRFRSNYEHFETDLPDVPESEVEA